VDKPVRNYLVIFGILACLGVALCILFYMRNYKLQNDLNGAVIHLKDLEKDKDTLKDENAALNKELSRNIELVKIAYQQKSDLEKSMADTTDDLDKAIATIGQLQKKTEEKDAYISGLQKEGPSNTTGFKKGVRLAAEGRFEEAQKELDGELTDINGALSILSDLNKGAISKEYAAYLFEGSLYLMDGKYPEAVTSLEKAWEINPKDPDVNYNLGSAYFYLKEYQKSIVYLFTALKLQPEDLQAYELIAKAYYNTGQYQKAKEILLIAKKIFQNNGNQDGVAQVDKLLETIPPNPQ